MKKLSVVYYTDERYIVPTCTSALSLIEHNSNVYIHFWLFCDDFEEWKQESKCVVEALKQKESCKVNIMATQSLKEKCDFYKLPIYKGAQGVFLKMFMCDLIPDMGCNILFLDSDTLVTDSLEELAEYVFPEGCSCAAMIDTMNNKYMKRMLHMNESSTFFCQATFLVNPILWKSLDCDKKIDMWIKKIAQTGRTSEVMQCIVNEQGVLSKALEKQCAILPAKYMVLPGNSVLQHKYRRLLFGMQVSDYYLDKDIDTANENPAIVHYMHYIVPKPWKHDGLNKYEERWTNIYIRVKGHEIFPITQWKMNCEEKIKRQLLLRSQFLFAMMGHLFLKKNLKKSISYCDSLDIFN
ncbi:glycosyltransferase family 8 protein [Butyrivibrio sp. TB]|uniref:glycosyltransferase family 8 protein n=1 Tax=Butyrivibrio sp. TB TaxID=1520809 RepID=UPI0008CDF3C2|nr:glycosyltransferase [Butyrivibrio sp. TB]SEQ69419.1 Lipopolysaccharide biosynthesis protein, LPS:glycosyltransferase [Butyrivibrio sp. TB]